MVEVTSSFKATIIGLMIIAGAINTLGSSLSMQLTSSKISNSCTRDPIINTFSILTCKPPPCSSVSSLPSSPSLPSNTETLKNIKWKCYKPDRKASK